MSNWFKRRSASGTSTGKKPTKAAGWYTDPSAPDIETFWNGMGWTFHKWYPDPKDPDTRMYWDGNRWTGDRRAATEPPYIPKGIDVSKPPTDNTDWVKVGAVALGAAAAVNVVLKDQDRALASWDRARAQSDAHSRQRRVRDYQWAYDNWRRANWNNPNPPPPPMPPTY